MLFIARAHQHAKRIGTKLVMLQSGRQSLSDGALGEFYTLLQTITGYIYY